MSGGHRDALLDKLLVAAGFLLVLCVASSLGDPVPASAAVKSESSSVATPLELSQLVASASDRDEGLNPVAAEGAPPTLESDDVKKTGASSGAAVPPPPASEVGDMMQDPYHNLTLSIPDRDEEAMINSETDIVYDPHVNPINKTHEEEASDSSAASPPGDSTQQPRDETPARDSSVASTTDSSTGKAEDATITVVSLAEVTSLPASALVSQHDAHDHPALNKTATLNHTTQAAAILAGVLVLVALMGYLGLLLWRRVLERRYGNREMLVNEEDDFKHFEL